jgi:FMN-dependent dehydrogenase
MVDSGVHSGVDLVRALALGAAGVHIGRPSLCDLSVAGTDGAAHVLHRYCVTSYGKRGSSHSPFTHRTIRRQHRPADEPRGAL